MKVCKKLVGLVLYVHELNRNIKICDIETVHNFIHMTIWNFSDPHGTLVASFHVKFNRGL